MEDMKSGQMELTLRWITLMDRNQLSFGQHFHPSLTSQCDFLPRNHSENSDIVCDALRMNLPLHLVTRSIQNRLQTHGANYTDVKELIQDVFTPNYSSCSTDNQEVPMETNQLEDALMMNSLVVKMGLQMGAPPHLIKPKLRAKILSSGFGYADISELFSDLNIK
ncbi:hypothetical protein Q5P01_002843 [Channa striata]|uniref:BIRC2/3-like UBA domain-containing protein n=1 Tax=Channa striata TaxID=64152 RepID=A0AA88NRT4_CHASR|nr:hypothetical protein Q5P01_002843 [Channa striata]